MSTPEVFKQISYHQQFRIIGQRVTSVFYTFLYDKVLVYVIYINNMVPYRHFFEFVWHCRRLALLHEQKDTLKYILILPPFFASLQMLQQTVTTHSFIVIVKLTLQMNMHTKF